MNLNQSKNKPSKTLVVTFPTQSNQWSYSH